jgi:glycosyltransferase involved in cell wall biosynthesis
VKRNRLIILGEGPERGALVALAQRLGIGERIDLPGYVSNPFAFLRNCGVFVLSSRWEGFAMVVIEALACGAPIVSTDCPGGPADILLDGRYGEVVPVADAKSLASAMQRAMRSGLDQASRAARNAATFSSGGWRARIEVMEQAQ